MRYYLDTEFIEDGKTIDLISIGIVAEDGRELYLGNRECDFSKASQWVADNVLVPMGFEFSGPSRMPMRPVDPSFWVSRKVIAQRVQDFTSALITYPVDHGVPLVLQAQAAESTHSREFWAYYADYDWVVFCQLWGTMMDLPDGFPMYCRDIKQDADRLGVDLSLLPQSDEHHALADAQWNKAAHEYLLNGCRGR